MDQHLHHLCVRDAFSDLQSFWAKITHFVIFAIFWGRFVWYMASRHRSRPH